MRKICDQYFRRFIFVHNVTTTRSIYFSFPLLHVDSLNGELDGKVIWLIARVLFSNIDVYGDSRVETIDIAMEL